MGYPARTPCWACLLYTSGLVKPGLDADLLIYEGNPVAQVGAKLLETMIDGEAVYTAPGWEG